MRVRAALIHDVLDPPGQRAKQCRDSGLLLFRTYAVCARACSLRCHVHACFKADERTRGAQGAALMAWRSGLMSASAALRVASVCAQESGAVPYASSAQRDAYMAEVQADVGRCYREIGGARDAAVGGMR